MIKECSYLVSGELRAGLDVRQVIEELWWARLGVNVSLDSTRILIPSSSGSVSTEDPVRMVSRRLLSIH